MFFTRKGTGFSVLAQRITLSDTVELFLLDVVFQSFTANTLRFYRVYLAVMHQQGLSSAYVHARALRTSATSVCATISLTPLPLQS